MPIVRIDLIEGKSEEYRAEVGEIVYQTLVDVLNVPKGELVIWKWTGPVRFALTYPFKLTRT
jgi:hypothetical protein